MRAEGGQSSTARMRGGWRVEGVPGSNVRSELTAQAGGLARSHSRSRPAL